MPSMPQKSSQSSVTDSPLSVAQKGGVHPAILGFMAAVILTTLAGTVIQSQFNLAAIQSLGAGISLGDWLWVTVQDLGSFSPVLFIITLMTFIVAIPATAITIRLIGRERLDSARKGLYMAGTALGLFVALQVIDHLVPMPTLIAATRDALGTVFMLAAAAAGGALFAAMTSASRLSQHRKPS